MRERATVIIIRDSRVLLVRDHHTTSFSLPGGGIKDGETILAAAAREMQEELGMVASRAIRRTDLDFKGRHSHHCVVQIWSDDEPVLNDGELDEFRWWDRRQSLPCFDHVHGILSGVE